MPNRGYITKSVTTLILLVSVNQCRCFNNSVGISTFTPEWRSCILVCQVPEAESPVNRKQNDDALGQGTKTLQAEKPMFPGLCPSCQNPSIKDGFSFSSYTVLKIIHPDFIRHLLPRKPFCQLIRQPTNNQTTSNKKILSPI